VAQHDYVIANGTGAAVRSDLNNALAAIVSNNSGATEPATMYAYQWWADTSTGLLKLRNAANNAWITLRELDGTLTIEAGTVSAPGLAFASDLNTGIYSPSADQLAIATNGVERVEWGTSEVVFNDGGANYDFRIEGDTNSSLFFVDASAEAVGIGTTAPSYLLDLLGSAPRVRVKDSSTGAAFGHFENNSGNFYIGTDNSTGGSLSAGNYARVIWSQGAYPLVFATNDTQRAQIDSSGRLLIGTSSAPTVNQGQYQVSVEGTSVYSSGISLCANSTGDSTAPMLAFARTRGTTAGSNTVVQSGDALGYLRFLGGDGTSKNSIAAQVLCEVDGTPGSNDMPGRLVFSTTADGASSPTEAMRLSANGAVRIPFVYTDTTATAANVVVFSDGYIIRSTSSKKYKTDIETIANSYSDALLECRPVWYRSTCEKDNPDWGYWGFIAEEVAEVDPRLVFWKTVETSHDENGSVIETPCDPEPEGVQYDRFVPHLLNLIKRQKEQIEAMEARLSALEAS
jgi:hypothetical protein